MYSEASPENLPPAVVKATVEKQLSQPDPPQYEPISKGLSGAKIWRVRLVGKTYALRCWPQSGMTPERLSWVHQQLIHATKQGCNFLPVPISLSEGSTWQVIKTGKSGETQLWELAPWMQGKALSNDSPLEDQELAIEALTRFHSVLDSPHITEDYSASIRRRLTRLEEISSSKRIEFVRLGITDLSAKRLEHAMSVAKQKSMQQLSKWSDQPFPLQPVHIDSRPEHFLLSAGKVTGLIDFGSMVIDTPAIDVARLVGELSLGNREKQLHLVERYNTRSRQRVAPELVAALDQSGAVAGIANWISWMKEDPNIVKNHIAIETGLARIRTLAKRLGIEI